MLSREKVTLRNLHRAYLACGFVIEGRQRQHAWSKGEYIDLVLMGILRDEFLTL